MNLPSAKFQSAWAYMVIKVLFRVHPKGVVLMAERACFCLLKSAHLYPPPLFYEPCYARLSKLNRAFLRCLLRTLLSRRCPLKYLLRTLAKGGAVASPPWSMRLDCFRSVRLHCTRRGPEEHNSRNLRRGGTFYDNCRYEEKAVPWIVALFWENGLFI